MLATPLASAGLSNEAIVAIALMSAVAEGLEATGLLASLAKYVLGSSKTIWVSQVNYGSSVNCSGTIPRHT